LSRMGGWPSVSRRRTCGIRPKPGPGRNNNMKQRTDGACTLYYRRSRKTWRQDFGR
jgi:hypothetical protein